MGYFRIWSASFTAPECERKRRVTKANLRGQHGRTAHQQSSLDTLEFEYKHNILTLRMSVEYFLESLTVAQLVKKCLDFHETRCFFACPQCTGIGPHIEPHESKPKACSWWLYTNILTHILNSVHRPSFFGPCFQSWFCYHQTTEKSRNMLEILIFSHLDLSRILMAQKT
jgi:hypothetical protein